MQDITLVSWIPKKKKSVILLSSTHHDDKVSHDEPHKPEMILQYNKTKGGVDSLDKCVGTYTCKRKTNRWPLAVFCNIVDIAAFNAYVIFCLHNPRWSHSSSKRRMFLRSLGEELIAPHQQRRAASVGKHHSPQLITAMKSCGLIPTTNTTEVNPATRKDQQQRCHVCPRSRDRKAKQRCQSCIKPVCVEHAGPPQVYCEICLSEPAADDDISD